MVIACVLPPLGSWLATIGAARAVNVGRRPGSASPNAAIFALGLAVGVVGGIYGIGGGSILSPILLALGYSVFDVAGAALAATFLTSVAGILTYQLLQLHQGGAIAPEWTLGLAMGAGGLVGGYLGARLQPRMPETLIRRSLGLIVLAVAARYLLRGDRGSLMMHAYPRRQPAPRTAGVSLSRCGRFSRPRNRRHGKRSCAPAFRPGEGALLSWVDGPPQPAELARVVGQKPAVFRTERDALLAAGPDLDDGGLLALREFADHGIQVGRHLTARRCVTSVTEP